MYTTILTKVEDKIATITIKPAGQSNAFAQETYIEVRTHCWPLARTRMWGPL